MLLQLLMQSPKLHCSFAISCANSHLAARAKEGPSHHSLFQFMLFRLFLPLRNYLDYLCTIYQFGLLLIKAITFWVHYFLDPIYNFHWYLQLFAMYNCKCQQHAEVYLLDENIGKTPQQPSHPYLSYPKHLLAVQYIICLCNTVLTFPIYTEFSSIL